MSGAELRMSRAAQRAIARKALTKGTGTRGLRSIMEGLLVEAMFQVPDMREGSAAAAAGTSAAGVGVSAAADVLVLLDEEGVTSERGARVMRRHEAEVIGQCNQVGSVLVLSAVGYMPLTSDCQGQNLTWF
ncbi:hypothetical protein FOA52_003593 [Chlamydomonas sp. UWO 241]|nr:hypothetical protein FOA52_003593 [Chlamydomonas sp. UWO 241]